jgi:hypothetical protein
MNTDLSMQALTKAIADIRAMSEERESVLLTQPTKLVLFDCDRERAQEIARSLHFQGAQPCPVPTK